MAESFLYFRCPSVPLIKFPLCSVLLIETAFPSGLYSIPFPISSTDALFMHVSNMWTALLYAFLKTSLFLCYLLLILEITNCMCSWGWGVDYVFSLISYCWVYMVQWSGACQSYTYFGSFLLISAESTDCTYLWTTRARQALSPSCYSLSCTSWEANGLG